MFSLFSSALYYQLCPLPHRTYYIPSYEDAALQSNSAKRRLLMRELEKLCVYIHRRRWATTVCVRVQRALGTAALRQQPCVYILYGPFLHSLYLYVYTAEFVCTCSACVSIRVYIYRLSLSLSLSRTPRDKPHAVYISATHCACDVSLSLSHWCIMAAYIYTRDRVDILLDGVGDDTHTHTRIYLSVRLHCCRDSSFCFARLLFIATSDDYKEYIGIARIRYILISSRAANVILLLL